MFCALSSSRVIELRVGLEDSPGGRRDDVTNKAAVLRSHVILKVLLMVIRALNSHPARF